MGFSFTAASTTTAHQHSTLASDGGVLSTVDTRINAFSPMSLVIGLGGN